jgi:excisionase family DNA binding protein
MSRARVRVAPRTVRQFVADGLLPVIKLGHRTVRIHPQDLEAFIAQPRHVEPVGVAQ